MVKRAAGDFGVRMKQARELRGVSLRQIADSTNISVRSLEALERNDARVLPGGIFSRAFVRSYATAIGVDPEQAVRDFLVDFPEDSVGMGPAQAPGGAVATRSTPLVMLGAAIVLTLIIVAIAAFVRALQP